MSKIKIQCVKNIIKKHLETHIPNLEKFDEKYIEESINKTHKLLVDFYNSGCRDDHYLNEIITEDFNKFNQRYAEAALWNKFKRFNPESGNKGADLIIKVGDRRVFIEVTTPVFKGMSKQTKEDLPFEEAIITTEEIMAKWSGKVNDKMDELETYKDFDEGKDLFVIGINYSIGDITSLRPLPGIDISYPEFLLYGYHHQAFMQDGISRYKKSKDFMKENGKTVEIGHFHKEEYKKLSAVLVTSSDFLSLNEFNRVFVNPNGNNSASCERVAKGLDLFSDSQPSEITRT